MVSVIHVVALLLIWIQSCCSKQDRAHPGRELNIMGGTAAAIHQFPWQLAMVYRGDYFERCGASKIGEFFALTAGHCWSTQENGKRVNENKDEYLILSNTDDLDKVQNLTQIEATSSLDRYNTETREDDFVIIKTRTRIAGASISLVTPLGDRVDPGDQGFVSGFGNTFNDGKGNVTQSTRLLYYEGGIRSNKSCDVYREFRASKMLCFGPPPGVAKGDCAGDSGGPVVIRRKGSVFQVGVVSFGARPCGAVNMPSVEARISSNLEYIKSSVKELSGGLRIIGTGQRVAVDEDPPGDSVFVDDWL